MQQTYFICKTGRSLEKMDVLARKCHHLHDEETLQILGRFFWAVQSVF